MSLKRPVTIAQARRWPAAAARRESFCARMGGMRDKLTSGRVARDPRSKINQALAAWDCDDPELLEPQHISEGIRPMKITRKMVGAEAPKARARRNPIGRQETYALAEENLAILKKRYQALLLTMADLRDSLRRRKKGLPDDDMRGYTEAEISKLIKQFQTKAEDLRGAIAEYERGGSFKNPARKAAKVRKNPRLDTKAAKAPSSRASLSARRMVYQVQESRDGKSYEAWATVLYPEMAKEIARKRAAERPGLFVRVMSFKVEA